jgi:hypothetical protein
LAHIPLYGLLITLLLPRGVPGQSCPNTLEGLWGADLSFGPEVRGTLTVQRSGSAWHASIAGMEARVDADRQRLSFQLPGDQGAFRGQLLDAGQHIRGQWIQPVTAHVWGTSYATPVELSRLTCGGGGMTSSCHGS